MRQHTAIRTLVQHASGFAARGCLVLAAAALAACTATESTHPLRGAATSVGWATSVAEPKDFVRARRQPGELAYVPVGRGGTPRPVQLRNPDAVRSLEAELDAQRDREEAFARRPLPRAAYGQAFPSVARPARPSQSERPAPGAPESFPVNPNRVRQMRENARQAND